MTRPRWSQPIQLTSDELTALAHGLDAPGFPGVPNSSYDALDGVTHPLLDKAFLACLVARGLLLPDENGDLAPTAELAQLLRVAASHRARVSVEQVVPSGDVATLVACELLAAEDGLLRHWIGDPVHLLELCDPDVPLGDALGEIVGCSSGGRPGVRPADQPRRGRLTELAGLLPQRPAGRLRSTMMMRVDNAGEDVRVVGLLGVLDGGPGDLWLIHPCDGSLGEAPEDLDVLVEPVPAAEVDDALWEFTAEVVPAR